MIFHDGGEKFSPSKILPFVDALTGRGLLFQANGRYSTGAAWQTRQELDFTALPRTLVMAASPPKNNSRSGTIWKLQPIWFGETFRLLPAPPWMTLSLLSASLANFSGVSGSQLASAEAVEVSPAMPWWALPAWCVPVPGVWKVISLAIAPMC